MLLKWVDLCLGIVAPLAGLFAAGDKLRVITRLARILDLMDSGAVRVTNWRASADVEAEIRFLMKFFDRSVLWLGGLMLVGARLGFETVSFTSSVLGGLSLIASGSLHVAFAHKKFLLEVSKFFGIGLAGVWVMIFAMPTPLQGFLVSRALLAPLGFVPSTRLDAAIGFTILFCAIFVAWYSVFTLWGYAVGYAIFAALNISRKGARVGVQLTKAHVVAILVITTCLLGIARALIAFWK